jgi:hypothetical protein
MPPLLNQDKTNDLAAIDFKDGISFQGAPNSQTIGPFSIVGGAYALLLSSTGTTSAQLNAIAPDGSTLIPCSAAAQAVGYTLYYLPAGSYSIACGAAFGTGQGGLFKVPLRQA